MNKWLVLGVLVGCASSRPAPEPVAQGSLEAQVLHNVLKAADVTQPARWVWTPATQVQAQVRAEATLVVEGSAGLRNVLWRDLDLTEPGQRAQAEARLAAVIAHEVAHWVLRHRRDVDPELVNVQEAKAHRYALLYLKVAGYPEDVLLEVWQKVGDYDAQLGALYQTREHGLRQDLERFRWLLERFMAARLEFTLGKCATAIDVLDNLSRDFPESPLIQNNLALAHICVHVGEWMANPNVVQTPGDRRGFAILANWHVVPAEGRDLAERGESFARRSSLDLARAALERAAEVAPRHPAVVANRIAVEALACAANEETRGLSELEGWAAAAGPDPAIMNNWALYQVTCADKPSLAVATLRAALGQYPDTQTLNYNLAMLYYWFGGPAVGIDQAEAEVAVTRFERQSRPGPHKTVLTRLVSAERGLAPPEPSPAPLDDRFQAILNELPALQVDQLPRELWRPAVLGVGTVLITDRSHGSMIILLHPKTYQKMLNNLGPAPSVGPWLHRGGLKVPGVLAPCELVAWPEGGGLRCPLPDVH